MQDHDSCSRKHKPNALPSRTISLFYLSLESRYSSLGNIWDVPCLYCRCWEYRKTGALTLSVRESFGGISASHWVKKVGKWWTSQHQTLYLSLHLHLQLTLLPAGLQTVQNGRWWQIKWQLKNVCFCSAASDVWNEAKQHKTAGDKCPISQLTCISACMCVSVHACIQLYIHTAFMIVFVIPYI